MAKADMWGNMYNVQWGSMQWGSGCNCLDNNCPPAVNLDMSGQDGQGYWANTVSMNSWWPSYYGWANLESILDDGFTEPNFINYPYAVYPQNNQGVDNTINSAAAQYGVQVDPKYNPPPGVGNGAPWYMVICALDWCQQNVPQPYPSFADSYSNMVSFAGQRAQGYTPDAVKNKWLLIGGLLIIFTGVAGLFLPGVGWGPAAGMIGIGLAFVKLGLD
jgi:hypothetical protein